MTRLRFISRMCSALKDGPVVLISLLLSYYFQRRAFTACRARFSDCAKGGDCGRSLLDHRGPLFKRPNGIDWLVSIEQRAIKQISHFADVSHCRFGLSARLSMHVQ